MPPDILAVAKSRVSDLEAELADLHAFLRTYVKLTATAESRPLASPSPRRPAPPSQGTASKRQQIEDAAAAVLGVRQPLEVPDILRLITEMGVDVGGQKPDKNLSSYLSRSQRFVIRRKDGGWFLADKRNSAPEGGNPAGADDLV